MFFERINTTSRSLWRRITHQYDQLNETFAAHQYADSKALSPNHLAQAGCDGSTDKLADKGNDDDSNHVGPGDGIIEEADVGAQAR